MSDIPVEKKLELVHQIRSRYRSDQSDLVNREQILYGRSMSQGAVNLNDYSYSKEASGEKEGVFRDNTFKIRLAIAGILVLLIILFDRSGKTFAGISTEQLFQAIETDYGTMIQIYVEKLIKMQ